MARLARSREDRAQSLRGFARVNWPDDGDSALLLTRSRTGLDGQTWPPTAWPEPGEGLPGRKSIATHQRNSLIQLHLAACAHAWAARFSAFSLAGEGVKPLSYTHPVCLSSPPVLSGARLFDNLAMTKPFPRAGMIGMDRRTGPIERSHSPHRSRPEKAGNLRFRGKGHGK